MKPDAKSKLFVFLQNLMGWIFIVPITYLIPKKRNSLVIMGNKKGLFLDNVKYFFLYLTSEQKNTESYFITADTATYHQLKKDYENILFYPSRKACWKMLRSSVYIVDSVWWMDNNRLHLSWRCKIVQIWHGIGFKKIQRSNKFFIDENCSRYRKFMLHFVGKLPKYNALISTGKFFTDRFFKPAFIADHFIDSGYPRNDVLVHPQKYKNVLLNTDTDTISKVAKLRKKGSKVILYAPTFRDTGGDGISDGILDLESLNKFALDHDFVFVFKLHPLPHYQSISDQFERIFWYDNVKDVYPFLPEVDGMISDYSSIFMDYILLNRPVFFLLYDRQKYETKDRELHTFFSEFLLGPIALEQDKLEKDLLETFQGDDQFIAKRQEILLKSYAHTDDNSSHRIFKFIQEHYLRKH